MVTCEICGRQFKNSQGLRGHKTFKHGIFASSNTPVSKVDILHPLSKLESRVKQLENLTGTNGTSVLGTSTMDKSSLSKKLTDVTAQVSSLTRQLIDVSSSAASKTDLAGIVDKVDELTRQISNLSRSVQLVSQIPGDMICLENDLASRASNSRVAALEAKVSQIEKELGKIEEALGALIKTVGSTADKFTSTIQQLQYEVKEMKLITDWVKQENKLRLVTNSG